MVLKLFNVSVTINKQTITTFLAAVFSAIYLYQAAFGVWAVEITRGLYIMFALVLTFLINPNRKAKFKGKLWVEIVDYLFIALSLLGTLYFIFSFERFAIGAGRQLSPIDLTIGITTILVVLEASRRTLGWPLVIITVLFLFYTYFGNLMPSIIYHRGFSLNRIVSVMYTSTEGIFGSVVYIFSTFIFLFVIFGAFLTASGAGEFFVNFAKASVGRFTGGPAQAAVVSSFLIGSVIGSSTANTAITGSITIPMMINRGYRKHVAASVEAVVSIGGQFMPPVMGAAAFLIAAYVGIPYIQVAFAGLIPALLFFISMFFMVYLESKRYNLTGIPKAELPRVRDVLKEGWYYFVPIILIVVIMANGFSPSLAGFYSVVSTFLLSFFSKNNKMTPKKVYAALATGARNSLSMATTAGIVGILVAAISLPGLGLKISSIILQIANGNLPIAIVLVMAASFVLGMGMNVSSAYLILVTITAPALVQMGVPILAAHFFIFWTSQLSVITPPVALSSYVAASIAKADVWKTSWYSLRMGLAIYYIPIMFIFIPELLLLQGDWLDILWKFFTTSVGVLAFSSMMQGFLLRITRLPDRLLLVLSAVLLVLPTVYTDFIGFALLAVVFFLQSRRAKDPIPVLVPES